MRDGLVASYPIVFPYFGESIVLAVGVAQGEVVNVDVRAEDD